MLNSFLNNFLFNACTLSQQNFFFNYLKYFSTKFSRLLDWNIFCRIIFASAYLHLLLQRRWRQMLTTFFVTVAAGVVTHIICKWLDRHWEANSTIVSVILQNAQSPVIRTDQGFFIDANADYISRFLNLPEVYHNKKFFSTT